MSQVAQGGAAGVLVPAESELDLAELGCDAGGCGDGCGGGNMVWEACTGEGDDIIACCGTCRGTRSRFSQSYIKIKDIKEPTPT